MIAVTFRPSEAVRRIVVGAAFGLGLGAGAAHAADLKIVAEPAIAKVLIDLRPRIEGLTQRRLVVKVAAPNALTRAQGGDEPFDAVVVYETDTVALLESNRLVDRMFCIGWTRQGGNRMPVYAAVSREAKEPAAAQRLVAFLTSFQGLMALTAHGLEGTPNE